MFTHIPAVCFLLGNSPTFEFYMPTFRNTLFHVHRRIGVTDCRFYTFPPMKMEQTECSETSAYTIQTPGNYPEESIQQNRRLFCPIRELGVLERKLLAPYLGLNSEPSSRQTHRCMNYAVHAPRKR